MLSISSICRILMGILPVVTLVLFSLHSNAQVAKLYPVDEADKDPSFFTFRARLILAIQQRDSTFILGILSPDIFNSFGGNPGVEGFKEIWRIESPDSKLWDTLASVVALGGAFQEKNRFVAPYAFSSFPSNFDGYEHGAVIGENVRVREQPDINSAVIESLSYDIVRVLDWHAKEGAGEKRNWITIELKNKRKGYIAKEYLRSPLDYRAIFEKKDGRWMLKVLVGGD